MISLNNNASEKSDIEILKPVRVQCYTAQRLKQGQKLLCPTMSPTDFS